MEISRQPGVTAVGAVNNVPLSGNNGKSAATVKGYVRPPGETLRGHYSYGVDGNYFAAMGFSLLEGRFLSADDSQRGDRVCVVDDDTAVLAVVLLATHERIADGFKKLSHAGTLCSVETRPLRDSSKLCLISPRLMVVVTLVT